MKLTKKLIPALGMLALSACMMVTSTFAWFSMNENVSATGMSVTAKGEQIYLQIIRKVATPESDTSKPNHKKEVFISGSDQTSVEAADATNSGVLYPTTPVADLTGTTITEYEGTGAFKWVKAVGTDVGNGAAKEDKYYDIGTASEYYLLNSFMIRLDPAAGVTQTDTPLKATGVDLTAKTKESDFAKCLSVLVVCTVGENTYGMLFARNDDGEFALDEDRSSDSLTGSNFVSNENGVQVDVYVFFDGEHKNCDLTKYAAAKGDSYTVGVNFTCK